MREIKFRVWNGAEMIYDVTVGKFGTFYVNPGDKGNGLDPNDSASLTPFNTKYHEGTPVMQYTGLKDKIKVELYESDLIVNPWRNENRPHEIVFSEKFAAFCGFYNGTEYPLSEGEIKDTLKVGNIYENPALLTDVPS